MQISSTTNNYNKNVNFQKLYIQNPTRMSGSLASVCANHAELNHLAEKLEKVGKDLILDVYKSSNEICVVGSARKFNELTSTDYTILAKTELANNAYKKLADSLKEFKCSSSNLKDLGLGRPAINDVNGWANWYINN